MRGVTLIEILIVLGLLAILSGTIVYAGLHGFERTLARTDGARAVAIVRHARARSMHASSREVSWSSEPHTLTLSPAPEESYALSGISEVRMGTPIHFTGRAGSIQVRAPDISIWDITVSSLGTIDITHDL